MRRSTQDSTSVQRKLFREALDQLRPVRDGLRVKFPNVAPKPFRDVGARAWAMLNVVPRGRPYEKHTLQAYELRRQGLGWPKVLEKVLGPRPKLPAEPFYWDCAKASVQRAVQKIERNKRRATKALAVCA
jgi:hypothetical protein